jgi:hypothetical protein
MSQNLQRVVSALTGVILLALIFAGVGFEIAAKQIWPYYKIQQARLIVTSLILNGEVIGEGRQKPAPAGASRDFITINDPEASIGSGYFALLALDTARAAYSVFLYSADGTLRHTWPIDELTYTDKAKHNQNAPHAMEILPDGTALVSFDWLGFVARIDACGDAMWGKDGFYHHSFSPASDGGIWTWYGAETAYGQFQDILKFDPLTGEDMARISLTDLIRQSPENALVFSMFPDFPFISDSNKPRDIFHPNDVEELMPEMASAFPQFEAGDLMVSIRELDMVLIMSQDGEIKWYKQGPWLKQHDPDFEPDGHISVYNNSRFRPRSSIITVDPKTGNSFNAMPAFTGKFNSAFRGKHQLLPNGNRLVTIPEQGQALEISPEGAIVMEFNNVVPSNPTLNDDLVNAKWLPDGFFDTMPSCVR